MHRLFLPGILTIFTPLMAQSSPEYNSETAHGGSQVTPETEVSSFKRGSCFDAGAQPNIRIWGNAEYLLWWSRAAPLPGALVTTGSLNDPVPAALDEPNTRILFGQESLNSKRQSGFRLELRSWFGNNDNYGLEGSGFYLPKVTKRNFLKSSDASSGLPILGVSFSNAAILPLPASAGGWSSINNSGETALLVADGTTNFGKISAHSSSKLWDVELNGLFHFLNGQNGRLSALFGAIYADLSETLELDYYSQQIAFPEGIFRSTSIVDNFSTHNQFYGGQLGIRGEWSKNWFFANFLGKIAMGDMVEAVRINGTFSDPNPGFYAHYGQGPGGIFAQPTNIGKHKRNRLAFIPQITARIGLNLLKELRISAGYDFFLMSSSVRPGDEIDRSINETQAGPGPSGTEETLTGDPVPKKQMDSTVYWAQGLNLGLEFRF
ncbi:MAG: BBP7 family outer membrane beta-barrel protein [Chlamydiae bacterium]|nr:BBP7 family outer membrane beta-barrel protein [Chlamydiota bacterium]